jgi:hypothetical protein
MRADGVTPSDKVRLAVLSAAEFLGGDDSLNSLKFDDSQLRKSG